MFKGYVKFPGCKPASLVANIPNKPPNNETLKLNIDDESRNPQSCSNKHNHLEILFFHSDVLWVRTFASVFYSVYRGMLFSKQIHPVVHVQKKNLQK